MPEANNYRHPLARAAAVRPGAIAYRLVLSGRTVTCAEPEQRSRRCAALLLRLGLKTGDCIAVFPYNHLGNFELQWAAHCIGLYYTTISPPHFALEAAT